MKKPVLGVDEKEIEKAEIELGICFPETLRKAWKTYNVIELRGGWFIYPVFDRHNPRKTCSHIVYANTCGRWDVMPKSLLTIAENGSGNQLVVKVKNNKASETVYHWQHDTGRLKIWKPGIDSILTEAIKSRKQVKDLSQKFLGKK